MDWTRIDTDLVTDAARNGIPEAAAELARREQARHTPGPWRKKPDSCEIVSETRPICLVHTYGSDDKDWLANAALMVRAPGLLAENERLRVELAAYARLDESREPLSVSEAGRKGGKVKSPAKTESARINARRPRPNRRKKAAE